jgi:hypothetical protein
MHRTSLTVRVKAPQSKQNRHRDRWLSRVLRASHREAVTLDEHVRDSQFFLLTAGWFAAVAHASTGIRLRSPNGAPFA